MLFMSFPAFLP